MQTPPEITFTYFKPDERKADGSHLTTTGSIKRSDDYEQQIVLHNGTKLQMDDILDISGEIFAMIE